MLHITGWRMWWMLAKVILVPSMTVLMVIAAWMHWQSRKIQVERWEQRARKRKVAAKAEAAGTAAEVATDTENSVRWFGSELAAEGLKKADILNPETSPNITPDQLRRMLNREE